MYVVAMNRLRGGYVDLDPGVQPYFLAGIADDQAGASQTYSFLRARSMPSHLFGSSMVLILVVNACVDGLFVGAILFQVTSSIGWALAAGIVVGVGWLLVGMRLGYLTYRAVWRDHRPRRTTEASRR